MSNGRESQQNKLELHTAGKLQLYWTPNKKFKIKFRDKSEFTGCLSSDN